MLTSEEYAYLQNVFRLRTLAQADRRSVPGEAIGDVQTCRALLERVMPLIGAPDLAIAASLFAKRVAFLASGNVLYAMSVFDKGLPLSLNTCRLEYAHDGGLWTSSLPMDVTATAYTPGAREAWREAIVGALFRTFFAPLWQSLSQVSGLSQHILWENTAVRVYSLYQGRMEGLTVEQEERQQADFAWLLEGPNRHCLVCHGTRSNAFAARYNRARREPECAFAVPAVFITKRCNLWRIAIIARCAR
jgi:hypothetical protein